MEETAEAPRTAEDQAKSREQAKAMDLPGTARNPDLPMDLVRTRLSDVPGRGGISPVASTLAAGRGPLLVVAESLLICPPSPSYIYSSSTPTAKKV